MRRAVPALLLVAALCGCRSTLAPEPMPAPALGSVEALCRRPPPKPVVPVLRGLRAYVQGDSVIVEASLWPAIDPAVHPWTIYGIFHEGDLHGEFIWGTGNYTWPTYPAFVWETYDGQYIGHVVHWRDQHSMRMAVTVTDPRYPMTGELVLWLVARDGDGAIYRTTVRTPRPCGRQIAVDVSP